ncbi:probable proteasome inhibitor [Rutidosis leptorrhynchoides]|uniref:probable proteasome inhibitor n=1 Tax=Rutidosis leptorrhynchoides TaxID=125765 RepID=UPI003A994088
MASDQSVLAVIRASRPNFRNSADKIAFAVHSVFLATGFNLNATGAPAFTDDALTAPFTDEAVIDGWNEVEDNYAFVYSSPEKDSKKVLVKCLVMNNQMFIDALSAGSSNPVHLEINIGDFIGDNDDMKYSSQFKNLGKLVDGINKDVIQKLNGSSTPSTSNTAASSEPKAEDTDRDQPIAGPYGLEDPRVPYHPSGVVLPPVYPSVGWDDVNPMPGAGRYPSRGIGGGGMLVGPNDPRFFGGVGGGTMGFPGGQPGVPPGARFDPFGPPDVPGFEPNRFTRNPRRPPGGTHPDLEHFGNDSDFI